MEMALAALALARRGSMLFLRAPLNLQFPWLVPALLPVRCYRRVLRATCNH